MAGSPWRAPWGDADWQREATEWIGDHVAHHGLRLAGSLDQFHVQAWSTVIRVPTHEGEVFFKAAGPNQRAEPALLQLLSRIRPGDSPQVLAADLERSWILMADGGTTLRTVLAGGGEAKPHFATLLPQFGEFQLAIAEHPDDLLATGVPDRRLGRLPELHRALAADVDLREVGTVLSEDDVTAFQAAGGELLELIERVGAAALPFSIDHGDLHTANVFFRGGHYTFFDWGDASVSHPFFSMTVMLRAIAGEANSQAPQFAWARDAYLEPFTAHASRRVLVDAFAAAQHLGRLQKAADWQRTFHLLGRENLADFVDYPASWIWLFVHYPRDDL